jgi:hypothetical protein
MREILKVRMPPYLGPLSEGEGKKHGLPTRRQHLLP